jgi:hypothetical protein
MEPTHQRLAPDYGPPPDYSTWPAYQPPAPPPRRNRLKATLGGLALAGLLVGGAATVFAADPTPSPSTSPSVTTPGTIDDTTTTPRTHVGCPDDQTTTDSTTDSSAGSPS